MLPHLWEDALCAVVCLDDDMLVELLCVHAQRLVEGRALVVVEVHGDVHTQTEETAPQVGDSALEELGLGLEERGEEVTVSVYTHTRAHTHTSLCIPYRLHTKGAKTAITHV